MNQREKLFELLLKHKKIEGGCGFNCAGCKYFESEYCRTEMLADYLIANGVVVLPCKVGDTVYRIPRSAIRKYTVVYIGISADPFASYVNIAWYRDVHHFETLSVRFDEIGKTVFLTREEAEEALKKRKVSDE